MTGSADAGSCFFLVFLDDCMSSTSKYLLNISDNAHASLPSIGHGLVGDVLGGVKISHTSFAKSDDQPGERPIKAAELKRLAASIQLHVARKAVPHLLRPCLSSWPSSVVRNRTEVAAYTIAGHRTPKTDKKNNVLSLNRSRMMQYHQILANKRKSDQPEETTVNELRVDDIGKAAAPAICIRLPCVRTHNVPLSSSLARQRN